MSLLASSKRSLSNALCNWFFFGLLGNMLNSSSATKRKGTFEIFHAILI